MKPARYIEVTVNGRGEKELRFLEDPSERKTGELYKLKYSEGKTDQPITDEDEPPFVPSAKQPRAEEDEEPIWVPPADDLDETFLVPARSPALSVPMLPQNEEEFDQTQALQTVRWEYIMEIDKLLAGLSMDDVRRVNEKVRAAFDLAVLLRSQRNAEHDAQTEAGLQAQTISLEDLRAALREPKKIIFLMGPNSQPMYVRSVKNANTLSVFSPSTQSNKFSFRHPIMLLQTDGSWKRVENGKSLEEAMPTSYPIYYLAGVFRLLSDIKGHWAFYNMIAMEIPFANVSHLQMFIADSPF